MEQLIDGEEFRDGQFDDEEEPMTAQKVSIFPVVRNSKK